MARLVLTLSALVLDAPGMTNVEATELGSVLRFEELGLKWPHNHSTTIQEPLRNPIAVTKAPI